MKRIALCAVLLLASGAWGQQRPIILKPGSCYFATVSSVLMNTVHDANGTYFQPQLFENGYHEGQIAVCAETVTPPAKQEKKAPPSGLYVVRTNCDLSSKSQNCEVMEAPPPFDVPPKEMDSMISGQKIRSYFCTDKQRVLLMSEDGKWHCFAFYAR